MCIRWCEKQFFRLQITKNKHKIYNQYQTQNQNEPQWKTDKSQYSQEPSSVFAEEL